MFLKGTLSRDTNGVKTENVPLVHSQASYRWSIIILMQQKWFLLLQLLQICAPHSTAMLICSLPINGRQSLAHGTIKIMFLLYIFVLSVYLLASYMCAQIRVWSCLVVDNFRLFTKIAVCKLLHCWQSYGLKLLLFFSIVCVCIFFCIFLYGTLCPRSC